MRVKTKQINLQIKVLVLFLLLVPLSGKSQKWVADTLTINFGTAQQNCSFRIDTVFDYRNQFPEFISVYEQKKWLFFPIDQVVKTSHPLSEMFVSTFHPNSETDSVYNINIRDFYITNLPSSFIRDFQLFSTIELYRANGNSDSTLVGTFYYDRKFTQKKKVPIVDGYEQLISEWSNQFSSDIVATEQGIDGFMPDKFYHFRRGQTAVKRNLYASAEFFWGLNFWGIDAQLWFSEPEANQIFNRTTGIIRYVNHPTFQSILLGRNVRLWNNRITNNWLFTHKMAFLIGINNWKDMQTANHKLEEIPLFNLSFTQQLNYNRFDKNGLVFGLGLMEDVHYIIEHKPKINIGLAINCAYKF